MLSKKENIKCTLAFDIYGTLFDVSGVSELLQKWIGEKSDSFMEIWRNKQLEYSFRRGLMNRYADFSVCTENALEFCCAKFQLDWSEDRKKSLMDKYADLPIFPEVKAGLSNLKQNGHRLFAFSNGSKQAVSRLLSNAQIEDIFEGVVSVEDVSSFKPNPSVYNHFIAQTKSTKEAAWLVSSNPFDVIGAIASGMLAAWVRRSPDAIFDPWGIEPTIIVNKITDLTSEL